MKRRWFAIAGLLVLACSTPNEQEPEPGAGGAGKGAGCAGRGQPLAAELALSAGEDIEVELVSLEPEAPVVGDNEWIVSIARAGEPLEGASLSVLPWMPDHEHASPKTVQVSEVGPGSYLLAPVYLGMVGYWEIAIDITVDVDPLGSVSFDTCLIRE